MESIPDINWNHLTNQFDTFSQGGGGKNHHNGDGKNDGKGDGGKNDGDRPHRGDDPGSGGPRPDTHHGGPGDKPDPNATWLQDLSGKDRNMAIAMQKLFETYGLGTLAGKIVQFIQDGLSGSALQLALQDTDEWKTRFAGNEGRTDPLAPPDYLALEQAYKKTFADYQFPADFYDTPADLAKLIQGDMSPDELAQRAAAAWKWTQDTDPEARQALADFYGLEDPRDIAAWAIDPDVGKALIDRRIRAVEIGTLARRNGVAGADRSISELLADQGVDLGRAEQGLQELGLSDDALRAGASRFNVDYTDEDALLDFVGGTASARRKREQIAGLEQGLFDDRGKVALSGTASDQSGTSAKTSGSF